MLVAYQLWRFLTSPDPFSLTVAEVPPDWHVPPSYLAPDSSDSGGEDSYELGTSSSGFASPREPKELEAVGEQPKRPIDRSRWSKVRRSRSKQESGGYGRLVEM